MTWICGLRLLALALICCGFGWFMFLIGFARGVRHEGKRLRRRLMLAGSQFANGNDY